MKNKIVNFILIALFIPVLVGFFAIETNYRGLFRTPTPTITFTATVTASGTPSVTPSATLTRTPSRTATRTPTRTATPTVTSTATARETIDVTQIAGAFARWTGPR